MRGNFLGTFTSQRLGFRALTLHQSPLMRGMVLSALVAALVSSICSPMQRSLCELGAFCAAVDLPSVVRPADEEPRQASPAAQLENNELVHPVRSNENWTATSGPITVRAYWLSIHQLYMRVQAPTWTLLRFTPPVCTYRNGWCRTSFLLDDIRMKLPSEYETKASSLGLHHSARRNRDLDFHVCNKARWLSAVKSVVPVSRCRSCSHASITNTGSSADAKAGAALSGSFHVPFGDISLYLLSTRTLTVSNGESVSLASETPHSRQPGSPSFSLPLGPTGTP
jgi:hypothetical protein